MSRHQANYYRSRKQKKKTGFPFIVLKPVSSAVSSDGSFLFTAYTRKNVVFAQSTSPLPESSPHRTRVATKLGGRMNH